MSGGPVPAFPDAPEDPHCADALHETRKLTQAEIDALREFFALLDEWDKKRHSKSKHIDNNNV
jgi:hypothetical protein